MFVNPDFLKNNVEISSIKYKEIENKIYLTNNKLIVNSKSENLLNELKKYITTCINFYFSVAFINFSGLQLLLDSFKESEERGIHGQILTSTYLNFTEPKALEKIKQFKNIDLKIFVATKETGFHTKAYIFENQDEYKIIIGSSNITQRALKSNVEWNVRTISKKNDSFVKEVLEEYLNLWKSSSKVTEEFLKKYSNFIRAIKKTQRLKILNLDDYELIKPNSMQKKAIENLNKLRLSGESKALIIAATGTGKTYMSAFDVANYKPLKMLFLAHREDILLKSEKTFIKLAANKNIKTGLLAGNHKDFNANYLFSTVKSMNINLNKFRRNEFEYIIIDEAHHAASPSYKNIINYFKPKFILGMTATPERCDNIFDIFDNNIALELRLREALENNLIILFHYFGITDIESIDLSNVDINDIAELSKRLKVNERIDFIIKKMKFYGYDGENLKCLGFCASIDHAEYMANGFNKRGIKSACLTGQNSAHERENIIKKLESNSDNLKVIFTVDVFNEGIDIPSLNMVLMLRPTKSPIVFIQQLGRGLRKYEGKSFLTVLDFIGNYNRSFLIAIALNGARYYDKDSLKVAVSTQFANIPGCTNIEMDRIAQERILKQLTLENFNSMKYLKDEYFEFKKMNSGKIPYMLTDYMKYDGAPDPLKFINKEKTYLGFIAKVEKDDNIKALLKNETFFKILREISSKLPIKRVYEFCIIKYLLNHEKITLKEAKREILKYIDKVDDESIKHAFNCLNQNYYDPSQIKHSVRLFNLENSILNKRWNFQKIISNKIYRKYIEDTVNYALIRYEKEFGSTYYGIPFFKLYEQYQMADTALLSNYTKIHSSFRGSGLTINLNNYFLFIDLYKGKAIKESINYKDNFLDKTLFQWQTPNNVSQNSERGKNIIFNRERKINLHLFVRKYKQIDGLIQPYIYIGKGDTIKYDGEKPITVNIKLQNEVPENLYSEFIKVV